MIRHALSILILTSTSACAGWCDPTRDECWPREVKPKPPQVKAWVRHAPAKVIVRKDVVSKPEKIDEVGTCRPPLDALGDVVHTWDNGKASARKAWMERVRWIYGERFMEHKLARDMHYQCNRVDVPKTEGVLGAAANEATHALRCEVRAAPCAAPIVRDEK